MHPDLISRFVLYLILCTRTSSVVLSFISYCAHGPHRSFYPLSYITHHFLIACSNYNCLLWKSITFPFVYIISKGGMLSSYFNCNFSLIETIYHIRFISPIYNLRIIVLYDRKEECAVDAFPISHTTYSIKFFSYNKKVFVEIKNTILIQ